MIINLLKWIHVLCIHLLHMNLLYCILQTHENKAKVNFDLVYTQIKKGNVENCCKQKAEREREIEPLG